MGDCNCRRDAATCFYLARTATRTRTPGTKCSIIIMCLVNYCVKSRLANKLSQSQPTSPKTLGLGYRTRKANGKCSAEAKTGQGMELLREVWLGREGAL